MKLNYGGKEKAKSEKPLLFCTVKKLLFVCFKGASTQSQAHRKDHGSSANRVSIWKGYYRLHQVLPPSSLFCFPPLYLYNK